MKYLTRKLCKFLWHIENVQICTYKTFNPCFKTDYICNKNNQERILKNINIRKGVGNIILINELNDKMIKAFEGDKERFLRLIEQEIYKLPNDTHPDVIDYNDEPKEVEYIDAKPKFDFNPFDLGDIGNKMNILRTDNLSAMTGFFLIIFFYTYL